MATVIYLPKKDGAAEALGKAGGEYFDRQAKERIAANKAEQLGNLFAGIQQGGEAGNKAVTDSIKNRSITDPTDVINLIGQLRKNNSSDTIKVSGFDKNGKEVPFAVSKDDLKTGAGENNANNIGLTLRNPGKQNDFYEDSVKQKYVGSSSSRINGKITLPEWKSKYGTSTQAKPTDKDKAIGDYLKGSKDVNGVTLQNTPINRKRAREFLDKRTKATEVINAAFGKKTGDDWTIEHPLKNQMAIIAKMQVEGFIMQDGLSAEQAGANAVLLVKEVYKDKLDANNEPLKTDEKKGGVFEAIGNMFNSTDEKVADETRKSPNYIGDFNEQPIEIPDEITSPAAAMEHIMKTYKMSKEDARQFLLDNAPSE